MAEDSVDSGSGNSTWDAPMVGSAVVVGTGTAARVNIPVPGTNGLVLSLEPPPNFEKTTSAIFIRNPADTRFGKPFLRLDYGRNPARGNLVDFHWNIEGKAARQAFPGITNHMTVGSGGAALYTAAKAFKILGKVFIVSGLVLDSVSILTSDRPLRRGVQVLSGWEGAAILAAQVGRLGAGIGSVVEPGFGTIIGGGAGAIVGGIFGYITASTAAGYIYDYAENTIFRPAEEVPVPQ